uniref:Ig-like domain-containing protein n=1 Tax=Glossina morsitans morsitans TaxID=37546 RepID=A0A1B0G3J3_GLOMM
MYLNSFSRTVLSLIIILILNCGNLEAQRTTVGRGVLRRNYTGKKPVVIQHRTPDAVNYYDHENVTFHFIGFFRQGAKIIKSSHFELDYTLGRKITFFCMAQGNPRPTITWFKDGAELYQHRFFQVHESHIDGDIIKSKMEIDPTTQMDAGYYECQADNIYAIDRRGFRTDYVMINF